MVEYDISGVVMYNTRLFHKGGARVKSRLAGVWLALIDPPSTEDERAVLVWRERLKNARQLARSGVVQAFAVQPGRLAARVEHPITQVIHSVRVLAPRAGEDAWNIVADLASRTAETAAAIAQRRLPDEVIVPLALARSDIVVEADGVALPADAPPDALFITPWLVFAERLDDDPWLWMLFRGQTQDGLLALMQKRGQQQRAAGKTAVSEFADALPLQRFWHMGDVPVLADGSNVESGAESPVMRRLAGSSAGLRVGRRSLSAALRIAYRRLPTSK